MRVKSFGTTMKADIRRLVQEYKNLSLAEKLFM